MSKMQRKNQAKQRQMAKAKQHQRETSIFAGRNGAPRIVAVLPLCDDSDAHEVIQKLNESLDIDASSGVPQSGTAAAAAAAPFCVSVERFRQRLQYVPLRRDLAACLDAARVADFVLVVLSATVQVDALGELILRSVESQGMSTLYTAVHGIEMVESAKQRLAVLGSLKSYITHFHPEQEKLFSLDNRQECSNLMRTLCNTTPKGVHWRDERSWMLVEDVKPPAASPDGTTVLTGVVRGKGLKADRLVQLGDVGTFRIVKVTAAPPLERDKKNTEGMATDEDYSKEMVVLELPSEDRDDPLADLAPEEADMVDDDDDAMTTATASKRGVLLDDHHYFSEDETGEGEIVTKRVPKGTSKYQAAWYLDENEEFSDDDDGSDYEDLEMGDGKDEGEDQEEEEQEEEAFPEDGTEGIAPTEMMLDATVSEYHPQSEIFVEPTADEDAAQLEAYRTQKRAEAEEADREFPDEIELHPSVLARERLARYRGLKSLRTSLWNEDEDRPHEPLDYRRLLQVHDYKGTRAACTREALVGGVAPGTRVHVHLEGVPAEFVTSSSPIVLFSLLRHEHKRTVANFLITLSSDQEVSLKAKEELIVQCGPRRVIARPVFSQPGTAPNNVHKYSRFVHAGQTAVATFVAPVTWGSVPTLFFRRTTGTDETMPGLALVATGTALPPSTTRVVVKRVVLTGHPMHIHKKVVTVRYMFFNRADVEWFKALPLWTRRGRVGHIKEAVGTHGYFKATFDGRINPQDAVGVSLYKRVFPRDSQPFRGGLLPVADDVVMDM